MDGIVTGLTSIVPLMPDQSVVADRSGVNGPPVEVMPLPADSFMSDDATAELLNNPFTLRLDKDGRGSGAAGGERTTGNTAPKSGRTTPDTRQSCGAVLEEAYTLSLGNEENAPIAAELAQEMSRMKSYELLGKTAARRPPRKTPEADNSEQTPAPPQDEGSSESISGRDRSLLSRFTAQQNEVVQAQETIPLPPDALSREDAGPRQPPLSGEAVAATVDRQDISLLSNLRGIQLSASDIEAILSLEPEQREVLLNMLGGVSSDNPASPEDIAAFIGNKAPAQTEAGSVYESADDIPEEPDTTPAARPEDIPDAPRTVPSGDGEKVRLAAVILAGGKARSVSQPAAHKGSMANLRKANELPYSLYLFGNVSAKRKEEANGSRESDAPDEAGVTGKQNGEYLRLSEVIKMACVLHDIYYGGSGRFPEETPWYAPYVRYAIKNGIIQSGEFSDYNEYATRAETAYIFSNSVPKAEFQVINRIADIPDVAEDTVYGGAVYLLFRAGVLTKSGPDPGFHPDGMITRTEAASIAGRIITPEDRKRY